MIADCALAVGDSSTASTRLSEALTFATEIGDPCYEALALRGLALLQAVEDADSAVSLLHQALTCCRRYQDVYPWVRAVILTDLVEMQDGADHRVLEEAHRWAALGPLPDLAERLAPYRRRHSGPPEDGGSRQTVLQTVAS